MPWLIYQSKEPIINYRYGLLAPPRPPGTPSIFEDYCKTAEQKGLLHKIDIVTKELKDFGYDLYSSNPIESCINLVKYLLGGNVPRELEYNYQNYEEEVEEEEIAEKAYKIKETLKEILQDLGDFLESNKAIIQEYWLVVEPPAYKILTEEGFNLEAKCTFPKDEEFVTTISISNSSSEWYPPNKESVVVKRDSAEAVDYLFNECTEYCHGSKIGFTNISPKEYVKKLIKELGD